MRKNPMNRLAILAAMAIVLASSIPALAHTGRRFDIQVVDNQLVAQGYLSPGVPDDGGGLVRPYYNALHDHWAYAGPSNALADLPSFDILTAGDLAGHDVTLELIGSSRWVSPPVAPPVGTIPALVPLDASETIAVAFGGDSVDTNVLGTLPLASSIPAGGVNEIDLSYVIGTNPTDVIHVLQWRLSTTAPGIADSASVYTLLSPPGSNPAQKLHHASLYLENYLGVSNVPEPSSLVLLTLGAVALGAVRRRSRRAETPC